MTCFLHRNKMRQKSFFPPLRRDHGGSLSENARRDRRPLSTKQALHVTLRSDLATGERALLRHKHLVRLVLLKAQRLFNIRVYEYAVGGNHLHCLVRGRSRIELQNFFRVFAGHLAQQILASCPLSHNEDQKQQATQKGCRKNRRRFWALLIYSRIVTWGREFIHVRKYIVQNTLEALFKIAYRPRKATRTRDGTGG